MFFTIAHRHVQHFLYPCSHRAQARESEHLGLGETGDVEAGELNSN